MATQQERSDLLRSIGTEPLHDMVQRLTAARKSRQEGLLSQDRSMRPGTSAEGSEAGPGKPRTPEAAHLESLRALQGLPTGACGTSLARSGALAAVGSVLAAVRASAPPQHVQLPSLEALNSEIAEGSSNSSTARPPLAPPFSQPPISPPPLGPVSTAAAADVESCAGATVLDPPSAGHAQGGSSVVAGPWHSVVAEDADSVASDVVEEEVFEETRGAASGNGLVPADFGFQGGEADMEEGSDSDDEATQYRPWAAPAAQAFAEGPPPPSAGLVEACRASEELAARLSGESNVASDGDEMGSETGSIVEEVEYLVPPDPCVDV